jgi:hypothetical protein
MGFSAMVQRSMRVAAFAAIGALLFQVACTIGSPAFATVQIDEPGGFGCHESSPARPDTPDSKHICCSGDHSPDAILSAAVPVPPPVFAEVLSMPIFVLNAFVPATEASIPFSHPPGAIALRI